MMYRKTFPDTQSDGRFYVDAFIHSNPDPTKIDVVLVSRNGMVFVFPDVCLSDGRLDATHDQNVSLDVDIGTIKEVSMFNFDNVEEVFMFFKLISFLDNTQAELC